MIKVSGLTCHAHRLAVSMSNFFKKPSLHITQDIKASCMSAARLQAQMNGGSVFHRSF